MMVMNKDNESSPDLIIKALSLVGDLLAVLGITSYNDITVGILDADHIIKSRLIKTATSRHN